MIDWVKEIVLPLLEWQLLQPEIIRIDTMAYPSCFLGLAGLFSSSPTTTVSSVLPLTFTQVFKAGAQQGRGCSCGGSASASAQQHQDSRCTDTVLLGRRDEPSGGISSRSRISCRSAGQQEGSDG